MECTNSSCSCTSLQNGEMQHCALCTVGCALCTVHFLLCTVFTALRPKIAPRCLLLVVVHLHSCPCLRARHLTLPPHDEPHCPRCTTALMPLLNCIHCCSWECTVTTVQSAPYTVCTCTCFATESLAIKKAWVF